MTIQVAIKDSRVTYDNGTEERLNKLQYIDNPFWKVAAAFFITLISWNPSNLQHFWKDDTSEKTDPRIIDVCWFSVAFAIGLGIIGVCEFVGFVDCTRKKYIKKSQLRVKLLFFVYFITIFIGIAAFAMSSIVHLEWRHDRKIREQLFTGENKNFEWQTNVEIHCVEEFAEYRKPEVCFVTFGEKCHNAIKTFFEKRDREHPSIRSVVIMDNHITAFWMAVFTLICNLTGLIMYHKHAQSPLNYNRPEYYHKNKLSERLKMCSRNLIMKNTVGQ